MYSKTRIEKAIRTNTRFQGIRYLQNLPQEKRDLMKSLSDSDWKMMKREFIKMMRCRPGHETAKQFDAILEQTRAR